MFYVLLKDLWRKRQKMDNFKMVFSNKNKIYYRCPNCKLTFKIESNQKIYKQPCPICNKDILYCLNDEKEPKGYIAYKEEKQQKSLKEYLRK